MNNKEHMEHTKKIGKDPEVKDALMCGYDRLVDRAKLKDSCVSLDLSADLDGTYKIVVEVKEDKDE